MLISVIIPVYNGEKFLHQCLESVQACPSADIECIIVNDGSTDGTEGICRRFASSDTRFRLITKENSGVSDSRNIGLAEATEDYIFFLDADDYVDAGKWPEIISSAAAKSFDMVAFGYYDLFESGDTKEEQFPEGCDIRLALLSTTLLNTCWGKLLRREVIERNGLRFRKELSTCEDAVFILDYARSAESFMLSNTCVLYYRIHPGGVMRRTGMGSKLSDLASLYERRCAYLSENYDEAARQAMYRQFFSVITDLFRFYAKNRRIRDVRSDYKRSMADPTIKAVIAESGTLRLSPFYKRLEYLMIRGGLHTCLAVYFKAKSCLGRG